MVYCFLPQPHPLCPPNAQGPKRCGSKRGVVLTRPVFMHNPVAHIPQTLRPEQPVPCFGWNRHGLVNGLEAGMGMGFCCSAFGLCDGVGETMV